MADEELRAELERLRAENLCRHALALSTMSLTMLVIDTAMAWSFSRLSLAYCGHIQDGMQCRDSIYT